MSKLMQYNGKKWIELLPSEEELLNLIKSLIPKPIKGDQGIPGNIKDLSPEEIRDSLELLPKGEKLSLQAIEDLADIIEELRKLLKSGGVGGGGGGGFTSPVFNFIDDETPASVGGSTTIFTLHYLPTTGSLKLYRGGARQRVGEDYTLVGKVITLTIAKQASEILLADYRTV